jgi:hypothetical protein
MRSVVTGFKEMSGPAAASGPELLITGLPRSGNTLAMSLLTSLPNTVALDEAMRQAEVNLCQNPQEISILTRRFLNEQRGLAKHEGLVWTFQKEGKTVDNGFQGATTAAGRTRSVQQGWARVDVPVDETTLFLLKQPVIFAASLPSLIHDFNIFAAVRNPIAALGSWNTVDFGLKSGRAQSAEKLDPKLKERLDKGQTRFEQQALLIHWFFEQFSKYLPREKVIRYEDTIATRGKNLASVVPAAASLDRQLSSRNKSNDYDKTVLLEAGETLLRTDGAAWDYYTRQDARDLLDELTMGGFSPIGATINAAPTVFGPNGQIMRGNPQQPPAQARAQGGGNGQRPAAPPMPAPMPSLPGAPTLADLPLDLPGAPARKAVTQSGGKRRKGR